MTRVHGHDVMKMMLKSGKRYSKESLKHEIINTFGEETRFYTCSADNMTAEEIIHFLSNRGKFILSEDGFNTDPSKICNH